MNAYYAFRMMWGMLVMVLTLGTVLVFFAIRTVSGIANEVSCRHQYGADWQQHFEVRFGDAGKYRTGTVAAGIGTIAMPSLAFWLYRSIRKKSYGSNNKNKKDRRGRPMSNTERVMRARSRALLLNYVGWLAIGVGVLLVIFRWGIFADHANESFLGIIIFAAGYLSVMAGCWHWLQAKHWSEALMMIGFWPLPIAFIPFVRIIVARILLSSPVLLLLLMLMTPAILLVVIATLPDKSGVSRKQQRPMNWKEIGEKREQ